MVSPSGRDQKVIIRAKTGQGIQIKNTGRIAATILFRQMLV